MQAAKKVKKAKAPEKGYASFFITKTRENGDKYTTLRATDKPEWLHMAIREAHMGDLPNDWIYEECRAACEAIDELRKHDPDSTLRDWSDEGGLHEYVDGRVDIYTKALYQWSADMCLSSTWSLAEENANDMGCDKDSEMTKRISVIQYCAIDAITQVIANAIREHESEES